LTAEEFIAVILKQAMCPNKMVAVEIVDKAEGKE